MSRPYGRKFRKTRKVAYIKSTIGRITFNGETIDDPSTICILTPARINTASLIGIYSIEKGHVTSDINKPNTKPYFLFYILFSNAQSAFILTDGTIYFSVAESRYTYDKPLVETSSIIMYQEDWEIMKELIETP